jgi:hypothetical protein
VRCSSDPDAAEPPLLLPGPGGTPGAPTDIMVPGISGGTDIEAFRRSADASSSRTIPSRRFYVSDHRLAALVHMNMFNPHELRAAVSQSA